MLMTYTAFLAVFTAVVTITQYHNSITEDSSGRILRADPRLKKNIHYIYLNYKKKDLTQSLKIKVTCITIGLLIIISVYTHISFRYFFASIIKMRSRVHLNCNRDGHFGRQDGAVCTLNPFWGNLKQYFVKN